MSHRPFREQDLLFFGATTAGVSHELKNVVTIINEAAGLLQDFAAAAERGRPLDPARVLKTSLDISRNVGRAVEVIDRLNRFAHSADEPVRAVDLVRLLRDVAALAARTSGLRGRTIDAHAPDTALTVSTYAFGLHQTLFHAIRMAGLGPSSSPITVSLVPSDGGATIRVSPVPPAPSPEADALWASATTLASEIGVQVARDTDGSIVLRVPSTIPGQSRA